MAVSVTAVRVADNVRRYPHGTGRLVAVQPVAAEPGLDPLLAEGPSQVAAIASAPSAFLVTLR
jgi:hypothetical protein